MKRPMLKDVEHHCSTPHNVGLRRRLWTCPTCGLVWTPSGVDSWQCTHHDKDVGRVLYAVVLKDDGTLQSVGEVPGA